MPNAKLNKQSSSFNLFGPQSVKCLRNTLTHSDSYRKCKRNDNMTIFKWQTTLSWVMATKNSFEHQCNNVFNRSRTVTCHQHIINNENRRKTALICFPLTFVHIQLKFVAHSLLINSPAAAGAAAKKKHQTQWNNITMCTLPLTWKIVLFDFEVVFASSPVGTLSVLLILFSFFDFSNCFFFLLDSFSRYFDSSFIIAFFHSQQISAWFMTTPCFFRIYIPTRRPMCNQLLATAQMN